MTVLDPTEGGQTDILIPGVYIYLYIYAKVFFKEK
jgi:hypothetical protein